MLDSLQALLADTHLWPTVRPHSPVPPYPARPACSCPRRFSSTGYTSAGGEEGEGVESIK